jgi:hypothetical protein
MKKIQYLYILCLFCTHNRLLSQAFNFTSGAGSIAIADASVNLRNHYSILNNQATSAFVTNTSVGITYERKYLSTELKNLALHVALPTKSGTFGIAFQHFGFDTYQQQKASITYGRKLLENFAIGAGFNYYNFNIENFGSKGIFSFDMGVQTIFMKDFMVGFHVSNPMQPNINTTDKLSSKYRVGLSYNVSKKAIFHSEVEKEDSYGTNLKIGIQYFIANNIGISLGTATLPQKFAFGVNYKIDIFAIDLGVNYHQTLGFLPAITFIYQKK